MRAVSHPRRFVAIAATATAAAGLLMANTIPAAADPGGSLCQVAGTAAFSPNGPGASLTYGYSLAGTVSGCQSSRSGAPAEGSIGVGQTVTKTVPITLADGTVVTGTADYRAPAATGTGTLPVNSCAAAATAGTAIVGWPDGTNTVVDYTTQSAASGLGLAGDVVPGVELILVAGSTAPAGTAPASVSVVSDNPVFPVGDGAAGLLAFTTDDRTACTTEAGLTKAAVQGEVALGSDS